MGLMHSKATCFDVVIIMIVQGKFERFTFNQDFTKEIFQEITIITSQSSHSNQRAENAFCFSWQHPSSVL